MKIDLHCHSKHSKRPTLWLMQKLGCPESFTEPAELYRLQRAHGMDAVTITDHNVIDGALEIAPLENTFLGCEYTTYFPKDKCKVHILAYGFTEAQHQDITKARENILDLVDYFNLHKIPHICAHPLFWVNDRLTTDHVEQLVLLFKNWEINADHPREMNDGVETLVRTLTPEDIDRFANKHGIGPRDPMMWVKNLTSGSDDHSSLNLSQAYTEVSNATTLDEFWAGVHAGRGRIRCRDASPQSLARNYYGIAYQFYRSKLNLDRDVCKDVSLRFMDQTLRAPTGQADPLMDRLHLRFAERRTTRASVPATDSLLALARNEAEKRIKTDARLMAIMRSSKNHTRDLDATWFELVQHLGDRLFSHVGTKLMNCVLNARLFDIFNSLGSVGSLYLLLAPYFVSYALFARERKWSEEVLSTLFPNGRRGAKPTVRTRVADFSDTYYDVNGVALTLAQQLRAAQKLGSDYNVLTCQRENGDEERGLHSFVPADSYRLPEYEELNLLVPPFLRLLQHCYEEEYTHIHITTPGPMGLAGLAIARILTLPVSGTYHTAFPQYAKTLTDDGYVEDVAWRYMSWFYGQMDSVYVPSRFTGDELIARGIAPESVKVYPRGIDIQRFHPGKRDRGIYTAMGIGERATVLLYVGRVSKEKNLETLCRAYRAFCEASHDAHLVVTGDGPFRKEIESMLAGLPVTFTGYKDGEELATLYASADLLLMPSATETFGNVVFEALASGIPAIVSNGGAAVENVVAGETGLVFPAHDAGAFAECMVRLVNDPQWRQTMGRAARAYMETRGFDQAFAKLWDMYVHETPHPAPVTNLEQFLATSIQHVSSLAS